MPLSMDPEYEKALEPMMPMMANAPKLERHDIAGRRAMVEGMFGSLFATLPDTPGVERTEHTIKSYDGASIVVHRFLPPSASSSPGPAILHAHGGGMIVGGIHLLFKSLALYASQSNVQIFSVDYRIAPEHPHPALVEDSYAALAWLSENAKKFNVDPKRIATMGESAGGGIAAGITIMARDRKLSPPVAKQILVYPMLDDRNTIPNPSVEPFALWKTDDNITGWSALLGADVIGTDKVSPYAAPARVESVVGLPPTYIDVGTLDIFRDEDVTYAARLAKENIDVELHLYPGVPHAFEALAPEITVTKRAVENRMRAMTTF